MADVEFPELGEAVGPGFPGALGSAVECPVMHHGEVAIGGGVDVEFNNIGPRVESGPHRRERVFEQPMARRVDAFGGAGVVLQPLAVIGLMHPPMGDERDGTIGGRRYTPTSIVNANASKCGKCAK